MSKIYAVHTHFHLHVYGESLAEVLNAFVPFKFHSCLLKDEIHQEVVFAFHQFKKKSRGSPLQVKLALHHKETTN